MPTLTTKPKPLRTAVECRFIEHVQSSIVAGTSRLAALKQRYDLVQETFPIWPVEVQDLHRLVATGSLPALLPLLLPLVPPLITVVMHEFNLPLK